MDVGKLDIEVSQGDEKTVTSEWMNCWRKFKFLALALFFVGLGKAFSVTEFSSRTFWWDNEIV